MKWMVVRLPSICAFTLTVALAATGTQTMRAQSAPGQPIVDCSNAQARIEQLSSGLPVMEDALKRSEARMDSLQNELKLGKEEAQKQETELAQEQMKESASEALDEVVPLRARLKAFQAAGQAAGISPSTSTDFIRQMNAINAQLDQIETLSKLLTSFKAGMAYGQQIQSSAHSLGEHISMLNTMLTNSGFYNQAGPALAGSLLGPAGPVLFNRVLSLIDTSLQSEANFDLVMQEQQEADTENTLRRQVDNIHDKVSELQSNCLNQTSSSSNPPSSPPPIPPQISSPPPPPPSSAASNSHAGAILLVGALAVGGVAAVAAGSMMNGSGSCGSAPENPYYVCPGSGCSAATTAYSNWCKCEGYAGGLDVNSGAYVH
jgi:anti-sigma factor RsiW